MVFKYNVSQYDHHHHHHQQQQQHTSTINGEKCVNGFSKKRVLKELTPANKTFLQSLGFHTK